MTWGEMVHDIAIALAVYWWAHSKGRRKGRVEGYRKKLREDIQLAACESGWKTYDISITDYS